MGFEIYGVLYSNIIGIGIPDGDSKIVIIFIDYNQLRISQAFII